MTDPADVLSVVTLVALGAAFLLIFFEKIGLVELLQLNARSFFGPFHALPSCAFCMLFWLSVILSAPLAAVSNIFYIATALFAAPLAKAIYETSRVTRIK
jgi:hypothetical protein